MVEIADAQDDEALRSKLPVVEVDLPLVKVVRSQRFHHESEIRPKGDCPWRADAAA